MKGEELIRRSGKEDEKMRRCGNEMAYQRFLDFDHEDEDKGIIP
jgi:hypothetical protein